MHEQAADGRPRRPRDRGSAVVLAVLVMALLTLLGMSYLLMAETEIRMAKNEEFSAQALYAAESGVIMVRRWFDRPMSTLNVINPTLAVIDRTQRMIDADGDPATAPVAADGTPANPYYKQGVDLNADGTDDIFRKPYRGSLADTLLGTENGPDMRIDETASAAAKAFLVSMSDALLPGFPSAATGVRARISRIDVYAPPYARDGGTWTRFGMGTVKVIARIIHRAGDGTETTLARRMVKVVLNEIPYNPGDLGPLHSCKELAWNGEFTVYWGIATAVLDSDLHNNHAKLHAGIPRVAPFTPKKDLLWAYDNDADFAAYKTAIDGLLIEDPWFRYLSGGPLADAPNADPQPYPFDWVPGTPLGDGHPPSHPPGSDDGCHANILQSTPAGCPELPYEIWKAIATSGTSSAHYFVWDSGTDFRENGIGPAMDFRDLTDDREGIFFFDTADREAPRDDDADGDYDNLTPLIKVSGGVWGTRGVVYVNSETFQSKGITGRDVTFNAPGEPFQDRDQDGRWDAGEDWINIDYPNSVKKNLLKFKADVNDNLQNDGSHGGAPVRNNRGPSVVDDAIVWGILYTNGFYDATGDGRYYGTVISKSGIGEFSPSAGTPDHFWDESLKSDWPPDDWELPRVYISRWETDL